MSLTKIYKRINYENNLIDFLNDELKNVELEQFATKNSEITKNKKKLIYAMIYADK